jgi:ATP-dependent helicase HrpB
MARVNLVTVVLPELELPPFDTLAERACLARAFRGLTLAKEAQAAPLREAFLAHLAKEQWSWLDELAPLTLDWPEGRKMKLLYPEEARDAQGRPNPPEAQVKLQECFALSEHPRICEGRLPARLWLCSPDGKRLATTIDWSAFKKTDYPKLKPGLLKKFPGAPWV